MQLLQHLLLDEDVVDVGHQPAAVSQRVLVLYPVLDGYRWFVE